jgi:uncharacterized protein
VARHYLIGGGSGFIGGALTAALRERGDQVTWISRFEGPARLTWRELALRGLPRCDGVVNLAGMHILNLARRWNDAYRSEVIRSHVATTEQLVMAMNKAAEPPEVFVSTAGKCFYGTRELKSGDVHPELDEDSAPQGMDFPAELVGLWERAAEGVDAAKIRHARVRIGVVLGSVERPSLIGKLWRIGRSRGFLPIIRLPFCLGLGATIGDGRQMFPWIHIADMVGILLHLLDRSDLRGRFNAVAPGCVTNAEFTRAFAKRLGRPVVWTIPAWLIRWLVGAERSSILLRGQLIRPRRTIESGHVFGFPSIEPALADLVHTTI